MSWFASKLGVPGVGEMSLTTMVIIAGSCLLLLLRWMINRRDASLPPGPFALPFVGNLLSLRNKAMETAISEWRQQYGPIFTVSFGLTQMVIITDIDSFNDALVKRGSDFSGRPFVVSFDVLTEGSKDIAAAPYGELWKFQRKIAVQALRQYLSGDQFEKKVHSVMQLITDELEKEKGPVNLGEYINVSVFNILHGLSFGNTFGLDDPFLRQMMKVFDDLQDMSAKGFLEDVFPLLKHWPTKKFKVAVEFVDWFNGYLHKEMDRHRVDFKDEETPSCLADNIIQAEKRSQADGEAKGMELTRTHSTQILADLFGAGVDTVRNTLSWLFMVLVKFPEVQSRMQEEIDSVVGTKMPSRSHRLKLVYSEAVIFETMRMFPAAPFGLPHETMCDTSIGGYRIPKKTFILLSFMSVMRDPKHWEDPLTFRPERFLDEEQTKIEMRHESFVPFSLGHRTCLGESLAKVQMLYTAVALLQKFTVCAPPGQDVEPDTLVRGFLFTPPEYKVILKRR